MNKEIRKLLGEGKSSEDIIKVISDLYVGKGKDSVWAMKRAKSKLNYIKKSVVQESAKKE